MKYWWKEADTYKVGLPPCGGSGLKYTYMWTLQVIIRSPSVWREWIEIYLQVDFTSYYPVSLRVEGVD